MTDIIQASGDSISVEAYEIIINSFENFDCDTLMECYGFTKNFDQAMRNLHPDYFEDEP